MSKKDEHGPNQTSAKIQCLFSKKINTDKQKLNEFYVTLITKLFN